MSFILWYHATLSNDKHNWVKLICKHWFCMCMYLRICICVKAWHNHLSQHMFKVYATVQHAMLWTRQNGQHFEDDIFKYTQSQNAAKFCGISWTTLNDIVYQQKWLEIVDIQRNSKEYIDGLVQERHNSIDNALLRLSCTKPSTFLIWCASWWPRISR